MLEFIKKNIFLILIFIITLSVGFLTFLTFIDKSFIELNESNLQYLLIFNLVLLLIFFSVTFIEVKNSLKNDISSEGSKSNKKYNVNDDRITNGKIILIHFLFLLFSCGELEM